MLGSSSSNALVRGQTQTATKVSLTWFSKKMGRDQQWSPWGGGMRDLCITASVEHEMFAVLLPSKRSQDNDMAQLLVVFG